MEITVPPHSEVPLVDQVDILRLQFKYRCPSCEAPNLGGFGSLGKVQTCWSCQKAHEVPNGLLVTAPGPLNLEEPQS